MSTEMSEQQTKKRGGFLSGLAYFAVVAAVVVGLSWIFPSDSDSGSDEAAAPTASTTTTVESVSVDAPSYIVGEEPIADAAEVILPSVVHIQTESGIGSGVVYSEAGLIMTAAHVVEGDDTVTVRLSNGEIVEGEVVGSDSVADIAVIQVQASELTAAVFNESEARVGQMAIAVGSPWNLESTVTAGIVSAVNQTNCEFDNCVAMVQTDAAINPGNSGGPLVDRNGQVIGINVSIFTNSGANDGVGFAVPTATAVAHAESIVSGEPLETAFLGIVGQDAIEGQAGALITEVIPDTAAAEAGIEEGDILTTVNGVEVFSIFDVSAQMRTHRPGETGVITVVRDGEVKSFVVTFGSRPADLN